MANEERTRYGQLENSWVQSLKPYLSIMDNAANLIVQQCDNNHEITDRQGDVLAQRDLLKSLIFFSKALGPHEIDILNELPLLKNARRFKYSSNEEKEKRYKEIADIIAEEPIKIHFVGS